MKGMTVIDVATASSEEIVEAAKEILTVVKSNQNLPTEVLSDFIDWLCEYVFRLWKDINGKHDVSKEEILKRIEEKIEEWAKMV